MRTFHYLPPGAEEQRAFALQFLGSIAGVVSLGALIYFSRDAALRGLLFGAMGATIWLLIRAAFALENKARRAEKAEIAIDEEALTIVDAREYSRRVVWRDLQQCEARGGRLSLKWQDERGAQTLEVGAREIENGMDFVRQSLELYNMAHGQNRAKPPTNFIPLEPR
jgi:uncharacterized membrane protein